mmetsp:Transcript_22658/g.37885  ORF Transcript_22658/g.37885 Transcript_22658/m.37885 type:complete len:89 (+) Transcript_22658:96-362(+)
MGNAKSKSKDLSEAKKLNGTTPFKGKCDYRFNIILLGPCSGKSHLFQRFEDPTTPFKEGYPCGKRQSAYSNIYVSLTFLISPFSYNGN